MQFWHKPYCTITLLKITFPPLCTDHNPRGDLASLAILPCGQILTTSPMVCLGPKHPMDLLRVLLSIPLIITGPTLVRCYPPQMIHTLNTLVAHSIHNSYQLWLCHKDTFKLSSVVPPLASFLGDPRFTPAFKDRSPFVFWINNNLTTLRSLTINMGFPSFESLQAKYKFPPSEVSRFLQLKNFFGQHYSLTINLPTHSLNTSALHLQETKAWYLIYINTSIIFISLKNPNQCCNRKRGWSAPLM